MKKKMNNQYLVFGVFILAFLSCKNIRKCNYFELYADKNKSQKVMEGCLCDSLECEVWLYYKNGILSDSGSFEVGLKKGLWLHNCSSSARYTNWDIYKSDRIEINYPSAWKIIKSKKRIFFAAEDTSDFSQKDYITVIEYSKDSMNVDSLGYNTYDYMVHLPYIVDSEFKRLTIDNKKSYDLFFVKIENLDTSYVSNLFIEQGDFIYNITFISFKKDKCYIQNFYESFIMGIKINNKKLIHTFDVFKPE